MREPRYTVDIRVDETTTAMFTAGRVTNISRGGVFIESGSPLPIQATVDLALMLPGIDAVLSVKGRVVWSYDVNRATSQLMTGSGIKFVDMSPEQQRVLEEYLARIVPRDVPGYAAAASA